MWIWPGLIWSGVGDGVCVFDCGEGGVVLSELGGGNSGKNTNGTNMLFW